MAKKEKAFNFKLYGAVTFLAVATALVVICFMTFTSRYTAFHPEELAKTYVYNIVQTGDGYNAYKNTLASKSTKYGDFIRKYYINPIVYRDADYTPGVSTEGLKGYNDESYMSENTLNDDGTLTGKLISEMFPYYVELVSAYGGDDYHSVYSSYIDRLVLTRANIFGDKYFSDEVFFTAFEANVASFGERLTGTEDAFDENTGVQLSYKSQGIYQQLFGDDYKFTTQVLSAQAEDLDSYKSTVDAAAFETYGVNADEISEVQTIKVEVKNQKEESVAVIDVVLAKIGMSWYVDNTVTDTAALYDFYPM